MARLEDLTQKEVINIKDGARLGFVSDVDINIKTGCVVNIIVAGPCKVFGLFGRDSEYVISWCDIKRIGDDIILVDVDVDCVLKECARR